MRQPAASRRLPLTPAGLLWQSTMAAATGLLLVLSFPKFELSWLAWVALAPLLHVLTGGIGLRRAFWLGWMTGLTFTFFAENWIAHSISHFGGFLTVLAYGVAFLFAAILALFPAIFAAAVAQMARAFGPWALVLAPIVWVGTEWLRPAITGVTWNALGISQAQHFAVARLAQYGGVYLVSWEVAAGSAVLALLLKARLRPAKLAVALIMIGALAALLLPPLPRYLGAVITIAGVQPNIPLNLHETAEDQTRHFENNLALTRSALEQAPSKTADLVIWAESPLVLFYENDPAVRERLNSFAREIGSHLIFNALTREGERYFNSAETLSPQGTPLRRYDKMRLVPFGEYVPWRPVLGRFVPAIVGDFTPGTDAVVNLLKLSTERAALALGEGGEMNTPTIERTTSFVRAGTFICYEAAYPSLVRRFVQNGATLLINVSDDAWFGNTAGARQHLAHAVMRAIENDRDLVRVTNTGVTTLITADGRIVDPLPMFTSASHVWQAQARGGQTPYTRHGDLFAICCAAASVLAIIASVAKSTQRSEGL